jgi:hypothetical protein
VPDLWIIVVNKSSESIKFEIIWSSYKWIVLIEIEKYVLFLT